MTLPQAAIHFEGTFSFFFHYTVLTPPALDIFFTSLGNPSGSYIVFIFFHTDWLKYISILFDSRIGELGELEARDLLHKRVKIHIALCLENMLATVKTSTLISPSSSLQTLGQ